MECPFLIGERIYLRPVEKSDAAPIVRWLNDPAITRTLLRSDPITLDRELAYLENLANQSDGFVLGIALQAGDRLIGLVGLKEINWRNRHACFGITLGERAEWNKGYGTEATRLIVKHAFDTLNLNRVWLQVYANNPAARAAYRKAGFHEEGCLRQETFREGRYWDTYMMAILREDYVASGIAATKSAE